MESIPKDLSEFYRLLQQQNRLAFSDFYDQYAGALYGEALRQTEQASKAENILLEAFRQAYHELPDTSFEYRSLFTWIMVIIREKIARQSAS